MEAVVNTQHTLGSRDDDAFDVRGCCSAQSVKETARR